MKNEETQLDFATAKTADPTIYDLKLHEVLQGEMCWGMRYDIMRVASGWIYQPISRPYNGQDTYLQPIFVPF